MAVVPHGVRLSLGGAEPVEPARVAHLAHCAELVGAPLVSEHIAFVRAGGTEAGHLLPVPRTRDAVAAIVDNVRRTQAELPVPLALEPIAALFDWPDAELTEAEFLTEILDRTGAGLLLDVANVYANARNRHEDPLSLLDELPLDRVAYVHVAGGAEHDGLYHDTHTDAVPAEVLDLVARAVRPAPAAGGHARARRRLPAGRPAARPSWTPSPTPPASPGSRREPRRTWPGRRPPWWPPWSPAAPPRTGSTNGWSARPPPPWPPSGPARWPPCGRCCAPTSVRPGRPSSRGGATGRPPAGASARRMGPGPRPYRDRLGPAARLELAEREVRWRYDGAGPPARRRAPAVRRVGRTVVVQVAGPGPQPCAG